MIKKTANWLKLFCIGFMLAVCIVLGVATVIPKRKDEVSVEAAIAEEDDNKKVTTATITKTVE
jgi:hypothetical protein